ncbi:hypothetical protein F0726_01910 [Acidithiobacillus caldus]|nr:hypothetical protein F0726_01910 [Acidithiobacillus caldus]
MQAAGCAPQGVLRTAVLPAASLLRAAVRTAGLRPAGVLQTSGNRPQTVRIG